MIETYKLLNNAKKIHLVPGPYALLISLLLKKNNSFLKDTKLDLVSKNKYRVGITHDFDIFPCVKYTFPGVACVA